MDSTLKTKLNAIQTKVNQTTVTDKTTHLDAGEFNTLVDVNKAVVPDVETAQSDITSLKSRATALEGINAGSRLSALEATPATVEVFLTPSSGNLTPSNAATYKMAIVNDGTNPVEIWVSNGVDTWTQFAGGGSGGFNYSPKINGFGLKPNSVSANGWTIQATSISDTEADLINGEIIVDSATYQTLASITLGVPLEWPITGQVTGTHSCILKIYDEAHPGGITSTVTVKLVLPTSTLNATATKSQMVVSGTPDIATQATITKIRVAYQLQGTDANADAAVTAGRYFDLTTGADITAFQGAGYTKALSLTPGATYIPSVQVTANTGTGVAQTGAWTAGTARLIDPAPTQPVISANVNTSGNVTVNLTTPSTDATPETPTYDIAVWDSVGNAWVAKQTGIAANSPYLTGTALGTSYVAGTSLQVRVTAKDTHSNATDSAIVNLTVQLPVIMVNGGFETGTTSGWTDTFGHTAIISGESGTTGAYCAKLSYDNTSGTQTEYLDFYQDITSNIQSINNLTFRFKPVTAEMSYTSPTDASYDDFCYVKIEPFDSAGTLLLDTATYGGSQNILLWSGNTSAVSWLASSWKWQANVTANQWNTFPKAGDQTLRAWLLSHFKAGKTWADVSRLRITFTGLVSINKKAGYRIDDVAVS